MNLKQSDKDICAGQPRKYSQNRNDFTYFVVGKMEQESRKKLKIMMDDLAISSWNEYFRYGFEIVGPLLL